MAKPKVSSATLNKIAKSIVDTKNQAKIIRTKARAERKFARATQKQVIHKQAMDHAKTLARSQALKGSVKAIADAASNASIAKANASTQIYNNMIAGNPGESEITEDNSSGSTGGWKSTNG